MNTAVKEYDNKNRGALWPTKVTRLYKGGFTDKYNTEYKVEAMLAGSEEEGLIAIGMVNLGFPVDHSYSISVDETVVLFKSKGGKSIASGKMQDGGRLFLFNNPKHLENPKHPAFDLSYLPPEE